MDENFQRPYPKRLIYSRASTEKIPTVLYSRRCNIAAVRTSSRTFMEIPMRCRKHRGGISYAEFSGADHGSHSRIDHLPNLCIHCNLFRAYGLRNMFFVPVTTSCKAGKPVAHTEINLSISSKSLMALFEAKYFYKLKPTVAGTQNNCLTRV